MAPEQTQSSIAIGRRIGITMPSIMHDSWLDFMGVGRTKFSIINQEPNTTYTFKNYNIPDATENETRFSEIERRKRLLEHQSKIKHQETCLRNKRKRRRK